MARAVKQVIAVTGLPQRATVAKLFRFFMTLRPVLTIPFAAVTWYPTVEHRMKVAAQPSLCVAGNILENKPLSLVIAGFLLAFLAVPDVGAPLEKPAGLISGSNCLALALLVVDLPLTRFLPLALL